MFVFVIVCVMLNCSTIMKVMLYLSMFLLLLLLTTVSLAELFLHYCFIVISLWITVHILCALTYFIFLGLL
jgi:hypothetical protein